MLFRTCHYYRNDKDDEKSKSDVKLKVIELPEEVDVCENGSSFCFFTDI